MPPRRASARNASAAAAAASSSPSSSLFAGLTIAVAGKFSRPLAELKEIVTSHGGSAVSTQTKACTHLLADALGSAKTDKAVAAGVAVVTEEWLLQSAKKGKLITDPKLIISPPAAAEGDDEPAAAAAAAATPKRKRGADAEESADAADADEADGDNSASAAAAAGPAVKKQKGAAAAAAAPAAASASSAAAAAAAPAPTSFAGKKFLVMGGFSAGKFKVESAISTHGGELTTSVLKSLDYCVYGAPVATDYGGVSGPGSKKYKEAKKLRRVAMIDEEEFFKLVAAMEAAKKAGGGGAGAAGAAGAGAGSSSGGAGGDSEAHPIVAEFREILALLGASDVKLEPATLSSITAAEDEMRMAIPPPLKALLLHVADGSQAIDSAKVGDLPYFWPSVADIREQFSYNSYLPIIYRDCKWMPYHMLDYDFCWNVIDIPTGSILQVDAECNSNRDLGYTFEGHISNFKRFLEERKEKNKPAAEAAAAAAGAGVEAEAASASSSSRGPSLADEFNASPLSGQSRGMGYTQAQKYYKAYKKAERSQ